MLSSDLDIFSDQSLRDPYANYETLRHLGPAVWLATHDAWALPRYAGVKAALRDYQTYSSIDGLGVRKAADRQVSGVIVSSDPPDHDRYRKVLSRTLIGRALADTDKRITALVDAVVENLAAKGTFDAVTELAEVIPVTVVADLIGLPDDVRGGLLAGAHALFDNNGPESRSTPDHDAAREAHFHMAHAVFTDGDFPAGTIGRSILDAINEGTLERWEGWSLFFGLTVAGMDTTVNGIGSALHLLAEHPAQWHKLKRGEADIALAWDEVLRLESPVQLFFRTTTRCVEFPDGTTIPEGARVAAMFGSANRDETHFASAAAFDVTRRPVNHLAFGFGLHVCLGAALARLEGHAVFRSVLTHFDQISPASAPTRRLNAVARGFASVPIEIA